MPTKARSFSKERKATQTAGSGSGGNKQGHRAFTETTSSKLKQRPAFNLDTSVQYSDNIRAQPYRRPIQYDDLNKNWEESLRN